GLAPGPVALDMPGSPALVPGPLPLRVAPAPLVPACAEISSDGPACGPADAGKLTIAVPSSAMAVVIARLRMVLDPLCDRGIGRPPGAHGAGAFKPRNFAG